MTGKMWARITVILAIGGLAASMMPRHAHSQVEWVKILYGPNYELIADRETAKAHVPVEIDPAVLWSGVGFRIRDVRIGNRADLAWLNAVSVAPDSGAQATGRGPGFIVSMDPRADTQGEYRILVQATTTGKPPVNLELTVHRPAAKLAARPLMANRVLPLTSAVRGTLILEEESGVSRITSLRAQAAALTTAAKETSGGTVRLVNIPDTIEAGGTDTLSYELVGDFPLGTSTGTLQFRSPQLAAPFDVPIEVRTRRTYLWLVLAIVLGLGFGWAMRVYLQRRIEVGGARLQGYDVLDRIRKELERTSDADFRAAVQPLQTSVEVAVSSSNVDTIKRSSEDADTRLRAEVTALDARLIASQAEIQAMEQATDAGLFVPSDMATVLNEVRDSLLTPKLLIAKRDAVSASRSMADLRAKLTTGLQPIVSRWFHDQTAGLSNLGAAAQMPASVRRAIVQVVDRTRLGLETLTAVPIRSSAAELNGVLTGIHAVRVSEKALFIAAAEWMRNCAATVAQNLETAREWDAAAISALKDSADRFASNVERLTNEPETAMRLYSGPEAATLDEAFNDTVTAHLFHLPTEARTEVLALVEQREYEAASETLASLSHDPPDETGAEWPLEELTIDAPGAENAASLHTAARGGHFDTSTLPGFSSRAPAPQMAVRVTLTPESLPVVVRRAREIREIFRATVVRTAMAGFFILIIGCLLYSPTYLGTFRELAAVFFWAFGLDVSVDAILSERAKLKPG